MKSFDAYKTIANLHLELDVQKRGYVFEQILREILPWDYRPPLSVSTQTEQLDAFFEWNSWHFLVEAKAKTKTITAGSHDWEDFALKLRKRKGQCIGLFCCISDINQDVIDEAIQLNKEGSLSIIIDNTSWKELFAQKIPLSDYLRYMVFQAKAKYMAIQNNFLDIKGWIYSQEVAIRNIGSMCQKLSSTFLRRHRLVRHDDIYVQRSIDEEILNFSSKLNPSRLSKIIKTHNHGETKFTTKRAVPKQLCIIRDMSGAGKTSLAIQIASERKRYFGVATAALQENVDNLVDEIERLEKLKILNELLSADRPIVYVVDSLDEAINCSNKHREVSSLIRGLRQLNEFAENQGLICYPMAVVFTIREDFWREWESQVEGMYTRVFLKRFSFFTPAQTTQALYKYSKAYGYRLTTALDKNSLNVLSHPFNMLIYSEANEYRGDIESKDILDENVLELYFERKKEDILKRPISGFTPNILMQVLSSIAKAIAEQSENIIDHSKCCDEIIKVAPNLQYHVDFVLRSIVSEQILVRDSEGVAKYRFRHMRFIEYLVSYFIANQLSVSQQPQRLGKLIKQLVRGDFLSLYYVHEFIRSICQSNYPDIYEKLTDFYAQSSDYMSRLLLHRRSDIACGQKTASIDIDAIDRATDAGDPNVCWDGFFVVAAKNNKQQAERIISFFVKAWDSNEKKSDRWKLLSKISQHDLLLQGEVFKRVLCSEEPTDWYVFVDGIIESKQLHQFKEVWYEAGGENLSKWLGKKSESDWSRIYKIIGDLLRGKIYERGAQF